MLRHPSCDDGQLLFSVLPHAHVDSAGDPSQFFEKETLEPEVADEESPGDNEVVPVVDRRDRLKGVDPPEGFTHTSNRREDIDLLRRMGSDVDENRDLLPESVLGMPLAQSAQSQSAQSRAMLNANGKKDR